MTREDALKDLYDYIEYNRDVGRCDLEESDVVEIINEIYDDFKSRTCGNCHYYTGKVCYYHEGWNDEVGVVHPSMDKDDGCNKFEKKESK